MTRCKILLATVLVALSQYAAETRAAILLVDLTGPAPELLGANGVAVNGELYNVLFVDGSCIALFDGCDAPADFTFTTQATAEAAAQALLDQVFIDLAAPELYDLSPELTFGCSGPPALLRCDVWIPYALGIGTVSFATAINSNMEALDDVGSFSINPATDTSPIEDTVWAYFTLAVPEPPTFVLLGTGLALFVLGRRRRRGNAAILRSAAR